MIGAGNIGSNVARAVIAKGHQVVLSNSRGPETLTELVAELGPSARAATAEEAATAGDVVLVSVPLKAYKDVPVEPLVGKIVLDANNYYWERDGHIDALDRGEATTSGLLQAHLVGAKVVKAFNHIYAAHILSAGTPAGTPNRRALVAASDYPEAIKFVTELYDELGFDTVAIDSLSDSWRIERDRPGYGKSQNREELIAELGPSARAASAEEAATAGDVVLVSVPLRAYKDIPVEPLVGKIVLDANNYYWERDGHIDALDRGEATTSGLLQAHLAGAKVVKAFNHIYAPDIVSAGTPAGTPNRRALVAASDYPEAIKFVTALYDELGFDTVAIDSLSESWRIERDRPGYGKPQNREQLVASLAAANRMP